MRFAQSALFLRACAAAALKDVAAYFTQEQGQVAVSMSPAPAAASAFHCSQRLPLQLARSAAASAFRCSWRILLQLARSAAAS